MSKKDEITKNQISVVILMGPPASGKGTVAQQLIEDFKVSVVTPGDIYRVLREQDTEIGRLVKTSLEDGGYCPNSITNRIMQEEVQKLSDNGAKLIVFDGYPRNQEQLDYAIANFQISAWFNLNGEYEHLERMATNRRYCSVCGKIFSALRPDVHCSHNQLVSRWDDTSEFYQKRYKTYQDQTQPMIDSIRQKSTNFVDLGEYVGYDQVRKVVEGVLLT